MIPKFNKHLEEYYKLEQKFKDKGMEYWFRKLVPMPPNFKPNFFISFSNSFNNDVFLEYENYCSTVESVYSKEWENWSIWIDYQKHIF